MSLRPLAPRVGPLAGDVYGTFPSDLKTSSDRRRAAYNPATAVRCNLDRLNTTFTNVTLASGRLDMFGIWLKGGDPLTGLAFFSNATVVVSQTHLWYALYNASTRALLKQTVDSGASAWSASARFPLAWNGGGTYIVPADGLYYAAIAQVAGTPGGLFGSGTAAGGPTALAPILTGSTPDTITDGTAPDPAGALTAKGGLAWVEAY